MIELPERRCCMGTKKKFTPEELEASAGNPYTLRVTADSISYTPRFQGGVLGAQSPGLHWQPPSASWAITRKFWVSSGSTILQSASGGRPGSPEAFMRAPGAVCVYQAAGTTRQRVSAPSDEAARRMKREILCLQQQMAFLKKSCGCTASRENSHGQRRREI